MADVNDDIEKYLKGELSESAMHALEKRALTDPFLADALEGAVSIDPNDFVSDVKVLRQQIKGPRKRFFTPMRIAATVVLLIMASYFIYTFVWTERPVTIAQNAVKEKAQPAVESIPEKKSAAPIEHPKEKIATEKPTVQASPLSRKEEKKEEAETRAEPIQPLAAAGSGKSGANAKADQPAPAPSPLESRALDQKPSAEISLAENDDASKKKAVVSKQAERASGVISFRKMIRGKVTSAEDGAAIPGANVVIRGTTQGTVSDANGDFQVAADTRTDTLQISFIGYQNEEVKAPADDATVNVTLSNDISQLSEVVVTGYGSSNNNKDNNEDIPIQLAEPIGGKRAYNKYLQSDLRYPQQALEQKIEGKVTIEFNVQPTGSLSGFIVIKDLGFGCSDEVIRLVKEGPKWRPSIQGNEKLLSTVRVRVKFKVPK